MSVDRLRSAIDELMMARTMDSAHDKQIFIDKAINNLVGLDQDFKRAGITLDNDIDLLKVTLQ
jgi:hypothetical protein